MGIRTTVGFALAAVQMAIAGTVAAEPRECLAVGVSDGDTITVRCGNPSAFEQVKVRLNGIDSPERHQPYGTRAKQAMSDLVFGKPVQLACFKTDRYGRRLCKVMVSPSAATTGPKTLDAGLAMVSSGMAWWYRAYAREQTQQERKQYERAETHAKGAHAGLWADADADAPWDWRRKHRSASGSGPMR